MSKRLSKIEIMEMNRRWRDFRLDYINEGSNKICNLKEVQKWLRTLEENKWRRRYIVDAKRITYFVNNGTDSELPESLSRKGDGWKYSRERYLANKYLESLEIDND